ncbi:RNA methyltransferase [Cyanobium sp. N.Huapi 1H5]|uniref:TrmH family RNA methyltransferase n=1 Tax=Cyanobium sp. N.Huapi 1H5 TaxID=2823719 RepID=UPI0020CF2EC5|nr:RNA methyltransferase [Cyanobium sp. N.Huapi 1H5]MCP9837807.1 RNA methyltransferase [Cyanobium sp. N.Huapi 1H5]
MQPGSEPIRSVRNPLVQALRRLHRPSGRNEQGLILLEGTHLLQEALALGLRPVQLLATPDWLDRHGALLERVPDPGRLRIAIPEVLAAAATTGHPDGVLLTLAAVDLPAPAAGPPDFVLVLDRLQDPGNLGTLLRTALAAGVDQVWLSEGADPLQPKVLRASSGAALALPLVRMAATDLPGRLAAARERGVQLVAAVVPEAGGAAQPYWELDWRRPTALLLGNEGAGLAPELARLADRRVTIPHSPAVESLNVAAAAALLLLERPRQAHGRPGA